MDPAIAARFNERILECARERYAIPPDRIRLLDGFESFIYEFDRPDGPHILRIAHSGRRSENLIRGEVDWINTLAAGGATVARAVLSASGSLVEPIDDGHGGHFLCTAFTRATGGPAPRERLNERFFANYGRLLGRMHALAKTYVPADPAWKRYAWDDARNNTAVRQMPARETLALEKYHQALSYLRTLPREPQDYGMIHQDAHLGNLFVDDEDNITLFDFDDCVYGHFIYDIAMVLFYAADTVDPAGFTSRFGPVLLRGYREENQLDPGWLKEIPFFMKLREIDLFAAIHFSFADGDHPDHPWCARYMQGRREKIAGNVPFIDYDWESLADCL